ncbi:MAG: GNAT family N-acetyltransferase [Candidatus Theseobacter exili]|nr:GNAT family N-acetyltransferase [Candidatus Theseobacter exili]
MFRNPVTGKISNISRRISSLIVLIFAIVQSISVFPVKSVYSGTVPLPAVSGATDAFDPSVIPPAFGSVSEQFGNDKIPSFFLIKDLHCHYEAQMNISKIVNALTKHFNINLVLVEGATGLVDTSLIAAFPDSKIKRAVARQFVRKGQVTGPEFLSITRDKDSPLHLYGIEQESLYVENLKAYRNTISNRETTDLISELLLETLDRIKTACYPEDLLQLDKSIIRQENGKLSFVDLSSYLIKTAQAHLKINILNDYPNLALLNESIDRQEELNTDMLEQEKSALMKLLEQCLVKEDLTLLLKKSLAFRLGKITTADFFTSVEKSIPDEMQEDVRQKFTNIFEYIEILKIQSKINNEGLFQEVFSLAERIKVSLFTTELQRKVDHTSKIIKILRKLFHLEVNRDDLSFFHANEPEFQFSSLISTLKEYSSESGAELPTLLSEDQFSITAGQTIKSAITFYKAALERDRILIENALKRMRENDTPSSIMLSGGFHTMGITSILKKKHRSYVVITPLVESIPEDTPYKAIMLDQRLKSHISGQDNALATPSNFSQLVFNRFVAALVQRTMAEEMIDMGNSDRKANVRSLFENWQRDLQDRNAGQNIIDAFESFKQKILQIPVITGIPIPPQQAILELLRKDELTAQLTITYLEKVHEETDSADSLIALNFAKSILDDVFPTPNIFPASGARKNIGRSLPDSDKSLSPHDNNTLTELAQNAVQAAQNPKVNGIDIPYKLVYFNRNDDIGQFFEGRVIAGAYHTTAPDGTVYVFVDSALREKGEQEIQIAIEHEELELYWKSRLSSVIMPDGISLNSAAHFLAWAQQISMRKWDNVEKSAFVNEQLENLPETDEGLVHLLNLIEENRTAHIGLLKKWLPTVIGFFPEETKPLDSLRTVIKFERSVKQKARRMLTGKKRLRAYRLRFVNTHDYPVTAAVPDGHGFADFYRKSMKDVQPDLFVTMGDYTDRGLQNLETYQHIVRETNFGRNVPLMGNHETFLIASVLGDKTALKHWIVNGGTEVLIELGYNVPQWVSAGNGLVKLIKAFNSKTEEGRKPLNDLVDILMPQIMADPTLRKMAKWYVENLRFYYIDPSGKLYVHAGIPVFTDRTGKIRPLLSLEEIAVREEMVTRELLERIDHPERFATETEAPNIFENHFSGEGLGAEYSIFWTRKNWAGDGEDPGLINDSNIDELCEILGVTGIVFGHTVFNDPNGLQLGSRGFGIDRGSYEEQVFGLPPKGIVLSNDKEGGIWIHPSNDLTKPQIAVAADRDFYEKIRKDLQQRIVDEKKHDLMVKAVIALKNATPVHTTENDVKIFDIKSLAAQDKDVADGLALILLEIHRSSLGDDLASKRKLDEESMQTYLENWSNHSGKYNDLLAVRGNNIMAFVRFHVQEDSAVVKTLAVGKSASGRGIGKALMDQTFEVLKNQGNIQNLYLESTDEAVPFYLSYFRRRFGEEGENWQYEPDTVTVPSIQHNFNVFYANVTSGTKNRFPTIVEAVPDKCQKALASIVLAKPVSVTEQGIEIYDANSIASHDSETADGIALLLLEVRNKNLLRTKDLHDMFHDEVFLRTYLKGWKSYWNGDKVNIAVKEGQIVGFAHIRQESPGDPVKGLYTVPEVQDQANLKKTLLNKACLEKAKEIAEENSIPTVKKLSMISNLGIVAGIDEPTFYEVLASVLQKAEAELQNATEDQLLASALTHEGDSTELLHSVKDTRELLEVMLPQKTDEYLDEISGTLEEQGAVALLQKPGNTKMATFAMDGVLNVAQNAEHSKRLILALKARGIHVAVISNGTKELIIDELRKLGLLYLIGEENIYVTTPRGVYGTGMPTNKGTVINNLMQELGLEEGELVHFDGGEYNIRLASSSGALTFGIVRNDPGNLKPMLVERPTYVGTGLHHVDKILKLLGLEKRGPPVVTKKAICDKGLSLEEYNNILRTIREEAQSITLTPKDLVDLKLKTAMVNREMPEEFRTEHNRIIKSLLTDEPVPLKKPVPGFEQFESAKVRVKLVDLGMKEGFPREDPNERPIYEITVPEIIDGQLVLTINIPDGFHEIHRDKPEVVVQALIHPLVELISGRTHTEAVQHEAFYCRNEGDRIKAKHGKAVLSDLSKWIITEAYERGNLPYLHRLSQTWTPDPARREQIDTQALGRAVELSWTVTDLAEKLVLKTEDQIRRIAQTFGISALNNPLFSMAFRRAVLVELAERGDISPWYAKLFHPTENLSKEEKLFFKTLDLLKSVYPDISLFPTQQITVGLMNLYPPSDSSSSIADYKHRLGENLEYLLEELNKEIREKTGAFQPDLLEKAFTYILLLAQENNPAGIHLMAAGLSALGHFQFKEALRTLETSLRLNPAANQGILALIDQHKKTYPHNPEIVFTKIEQQIRQFDYKSNQEQIAALAALEKSIAVLPSSFAVLRYRQDLANILLSWTNDENNPMKQGFSMRLSSLLGQNKYAYAAQIDKTDMATPVLAEALKDAGLLAPQETLSASAESWIDFYDKARTILEELGSIPKEVAANDEMMTEYYRTLTRLANLPEFVGRTPIEKIVNAHLFLKGQYNDDEILEKVQALMLLRPRIKAAFGKYGSELTKATEEEIFNTALEISEENPGKAILNSSAIVLAGMFIEVRDYANAFEVISDFGLDEDSVLNLTRPLMKEAAQQSAFSQTPIPGHPKDRSGWANSLLIQYRYAPENLEELVAEQFPHMTESLSGQQALLNNVSLYIGMSRYLKDEKQNMDILEDDINMVLTELKKAEAAWHADNYEDCINILIGSMVDSPFRIAMYPKLWTSTLSRLSIPLDPKKRAKLFFQTIEDMVLRDLKQLNKKREDGVHKEFRQVFSFHYAADKEQLLRIPHLTGERLLAQYLRMSGRVANPIPERQYSDQLESLYGLDSSSPNFNSEIDSLLFSAIDQDTNTDENGFRPIQIFQKLLVTRIMEREESSGWRARKRSDRKASEYIDILRKGQLFISPSLTVEERQMILNVFCNEARIFRTSKGLHTLAEYMNFVGSVELGYFGQVVDKKVPINILSKDEYLEHVEKVLIAKGYDKDKDPENYYKKYNEHLEWPAFHESYINPETGEKETRIIVRVDMFRSLNLFLRTFVHELGHHVDEELREKRYITGAGSPFAERADSLFLLEGLANDVTKRVFDWFGYLYWDEKTGRDHGWDLVAALEKTKRTNLDEYDTGTNFIEELYRQATPFMFLTQVLPRIQDVIKGRMSLWQLAHWAEENLYPQRVDFGDIEEIDVTEVIAAGQGYARKNILDTDDVQITPEESGLFRSYTEEADANNISSESKQVNDLVLEYILVRFTAEDRIGSFFKNKNVSGAYNWKDPENGVQYIFVEAEAKRPLTSEENIALRHEELEVYWKQALQDEDTKGFSVDEAAHIMAWAQQILEHNAERKWTDAEEVEFIKAQLRSDSVTVEQLYGLLTENRTRHNTLIKAFMPTLLKNHPKKWPRGAVTFQLNRFEQSFKSLAQRIALEKIESEAQNSGIELPDDIFVKMEDLAIYFENIAQHPEKINSKEILLIFDNFKVLFPHFSHHLDEWIKWIQWTDNTVPSPQQIQSLKILLKTNPLIPLESYEGPLSSTIEKEGAPELWGALLYASKQQGYHPPPVTETITRQLKQVAPEGGAVLDLLGETETYLSPSGYESWTTVGVTPPETKGSETDVTFISQDLNQQPKLDIEGESISFVQIVSGVPYLTNPVNNFEDAYAVLQPQGRIAVTFSDQYVPGLATKQWKRFEGNIWMMESFVREALLKAGFTNILVIRDTAKFEIPSKSLGGKTVDRVPVITVYADKPEAPLTTEKDDQTMISAAIQRLVAKAEPFFSAQTKAGPVNIYHAASLLEGNEHLADPLLLLLLRINSSAFGNESYEELIDNETGMEVFLDSWRSSLFTKDFFIAMDAENPDRALGYIHTWNDGETGIVHKLCTVSETQHRGVGSSLLNLALYHFEHMGAEVAYIESTTEAVVYYTRFFQNRYGESASNTWEFNPENAAVTVGEDSENLFVVHLAPDEQAILSKEDTTMQSEQPASTEDLRATIMAEASHLAVRKDINIRRKIQMLGEFMVAEGITDPVLYEGILNDAISLFTKPATPVKARFNAIANGDIEMIIMKATAKLELPKEAYTSGNPVLDQIREILTDPDLAGSLRISESGTVEGNKTITEFLTNLYSLAGVNDVNLLEVLRSSLFRSYIMHLMTDPKYKYVTDMLSEKITDYDLDFRWKYEDHFGQGTFNVPEIIANYYIGLFSGDLPDIFSNISETMEVVMRSVEIEPGVSLDDLFRTNLHLELESDTDGTPEEEIKKRTQITMLRRIVDSFQPNPARSSESIALERKIMDINKSFAETLYPDNLNESGAPLIADCIFGSVEKGNASVNIDSVPWLAELLRHAGIKYTVLKDEGSGENTARKLIRRLEAQAKAVLATPSIAYWNNIEFQQTYEGRKVFDDIDKVENLTFGVDSSLLFDIGPAEKVGNMALRAISNKSPGFNFIRNRLKEMNNGATVAILARDNLNDTKTALIQELGINPEDVVVYSDALDTASLRGKVVIVPFEDKSSYEDIVSSVTFNRDEFNPERELVLLLDETDAKNRVANLDEFRKTHRIALGKAGKTAMPDVFAMGMVLASVEELFEGDSLHPELHKRLKILFTEFLTEQTRQDGLSMDSERIDREVETILAEIAESGFFRVPPPGKLLQESIQQIQNERAYIDTAA